MKNIVKAKKKYGQNFLNNEDIAKTIVSFEKINNQNILEIGPGNLALTEKIKKKKPKKFIAVEIDEQLAKNTVRNNIDIRNENALFFDERKNFNKENFSIISNLPFNISSLLLIKWVKLQNDFKCINSMTLMFQKELAERIIASTNTKKFGRITIICKAFFSIQLKKIVSKNNFDPMPKVDAIVLKFTPHSKSKIKKNHFSKLEKITSLFFNERRKKNEKKIKKIFTDKQIILNNFDKLFPLRSENISEDVFYKMTEILD